jgi:hypothetical protein
MKSAHPVTSVSGSAVATAAALLFASVTVQAATAEDAKIQCEGVNACKGQSACNTAHNSCAGQNACKGLGWLPLTASECDAAKAKLHPKK